MNKMKVENVGEEYVFTSVSKEGEKEREYKHISEFGVIIQLLADVKYLLDKQHREELLIKDTLKELGVIAPKNANALYTLCKTILNSKVILDSEEYVAIESANGYITKANVIGSVYKKEYVDQFERLLNNCHQDINGVITEDIEKLEEQENL